MLLCISPANIWRVKGTLSIKKIVWSLQELQFCQSPKPEKILKTYTCLWLPGLLVEFFHCIYQFDNEPLNTFFKTWEKSLRLGENLVFRQQKNMEVPIFSRSDETLKVAKIYDLGVVGWFFFVVVRSQHKPIYQCNLEPFLLSNCFTGKIW